MARQILALRLVVYREGEVVVVSGRYNSEIDMRGGNSVISRSVKQFSCAFFHT